MFCCGAAAPLSAHVSPPWQEVSTGSEATLECSVAGQPVARVQWLRDGMPLVPGVRVSITTAPAAAPGAAPGAVPGPGVSRVRLTGVSKEDRGMYQCVASNDRDMAQGTAELKLGGMGSSICSGQQLVGAWGVQSG